MPHALSAQSMHSRRTSAIIAILISLALFAAGLLLMRPDLGLADPPPEEVTCSNANETFPNERVPREAIISGSGQITGTYGDDVIIGSPGPDFINAAGGNDTVCSLGGNDRIIGGPGDDWIGAGDGADEIDGGPGKDFIIGGEGSDDDCQGVDAVGLVSGPDQRAYTPATAAPDDPVYEADDCEIINGQPFPGPPLPPAQDATAALGVAQDPSGTFTPQQPPTPAADGNPCDPNTTLTEFNANPADDALELIFIAKRVCALQEHLNTEQNGENNEQRLGDEYTVLAVDGIYGQTTATVLRNLFLLDADDTFNPMFSGLDSCALHRYLNQHYLDPAKQALLPDSGDCASDTTTQDGKTAQDVKDGFLQKQVQQTAQEYEGNLLDEQNTDRNLPELPTIQLPDQVPSEPLYREDQAAEEQIDVDGDGTADLVEVAQRVEDLQVKLRDKGYKSLEELEFFPNGETETALRDYLHGQAKGYFDNEYVAHLNQYLQQSCVLNEENLNNAEEGLLDGVVEEAVSESRANLLGTDNSPTAVQLPDVASYFPTPKSFSSQKDLCQKSAPSDNDTLDDPVKDSDAIQERISSLKKQLNQVYQGDPLGEDNKYQEDIKPLLVNYLRYQSIQGFGEIFPLFVPELHGNQLVWSQEIKKSPQVCQLDQYLSDNVPNLQDDLIAGDSDSEECAFDGDAKRAIAELLNSKVNDALQTFEDELFSDSNDSTEVQLPQIEFSEANPVDPDLIPEVPAPDHHREDPVIPQAPVAPDHDGDSVISNPVNVSPPQLIEVPLPEKSGTALPILDGTGTPFPLFPATAYNAGGLLGLILEFVQGILALIGGSIVPAA